MMKRQNQNENRLFYSHVLLPLLAITMILTMVATLAHSAEVTLEWNSVAEADGYKIYYGSASRTYESPENAGSQTSYTLPLDPGTYYFAVTAYNTYGESEYSDEVGPTIIAPSDPPTSISLVSNLPSPQQEGTTVTFTAQAVGGSGTYEYRYWVRNAVSQEWSIVQDYSASANFTWSASASIDYIHVWARNAGSSEAYQVYNSIPFNTDVNPPAGVSLTSNLPSPQQEGTTVTFTAQAVGGSGTYEYRYWVRNAVNQEWSIVQDYSSSPHYSWSASANIDYIHVWARNAGSDVFCQTWNTIPYSTDVNPPTGVSLTSNLPSPQPEGTTVTFTAQAVGGSGSYEYRFWIRNAASQEWSIVQDYSSSSQYTWNASASVDYIHVWARNAGSDEFCQAWNTVLFSTDVNPPTAVSLTTNLPSPQPEGTTVTVTAQAVGGSGSYEYKFWVRDTQGQWRVVRDYSSSPNFTGNATAAVDLIHVWARNAGSSDAYQVWCTIEFSTN